MMAKYLVGGPEVEHFMDMASIDTGMKTLLGDAEGVDSMVKPDVLSAQIELRHAVHKIVGLTKTGLWTSSRRRRSSSRSAPTSSATNRWTRQTTISDRVPTVRHFTVKFEHGSAKRRVRRTGCTPSGMP